MTRRSQPGSSSESASRRGGAGLAGLLLTGLISGACTGGGGSSGVPAAGGDGEEPPSTAPFFIVGCSLGCSPLGAGEFGAVGCGTTGVSLNEEIAIQFSTPVDLTSVDARTFQVVELSTGIAPVGSFRLDPTDASRLLYRPNVSFDSQGKPSFGLTVGESYLVTIPGVEQNGEDGSEFVRSTGGIANSTRMSCTLIAQEDIVDVVPGAPSAKVFFDVVRAVDPETQEVVDVERDVLANGGETLVDVYRRTRVRIEFDDIMDPTALVNPVTGEAVHLSIGVDPDGDTSDSSDELPTFGDFVISYDYQTVTTTVVFTTESDLPSRGPDPDNPRVLVVHLPDPIVDLGGNALRNGGAVVGLPELRMFDPTILPGGTGEDFSTEEHLDARRTGAVWGPLGLAPGVGGGSGRLGSFELSLTDGLVVLDTDHQVFSAPAVVVDYDPVSGMPLGTDITVDDGLFEFSSFHIGPGARLQIVGSHPARILSRGRLVVDGAVDVSGADVPPQRSMPCDPLDPDGPFKCNPFLLMPENFLGGEPGRGGPGAGAGGRGGDLPDSDETLQAVGGLDNPHADYVGVGRPGEGIPIPDALDPLAHPGGGEGGVQWPSALPQHAGEVGGLTFNIGLCWTAMLGGSGAGGAYATSGHPGVNGTAALVLPPSGIAPVVSGGDTASVGLDAAARALDPATGHLRGGAGGGGGGSHAATSFNAVVTPPCIFATGISVYRPGRGAGGGGGGGALELHAGTQLLLGGRIEANGGDGGSSIPPTIFTDISVTERASPGGGGAGGAILLRAPEFSLGGLPGRIQVLGGNGGSGIPDVEPDEPPATQSLGGNGGAGLVRVEVGATAFDVQEIGARLFPEVEDLDELIGAPQVADLVSSAPFVPATSGPEARSGAQSCWMQPEGMPFLLRFPEDTADELGWDMEVFLQGVGPVSWRQPGALFPDVSLEELLGSNLGVSPVVVRFQGARTLAAISDLCSVVESGAASPLFPPSVSPWVRHPAEIDALFATDVSKRPNLIRYQVVFDAGHPFSSLIEGVTRIQIRAVPE